MLDQLDHSQKVFLFAGLGIVVVLGLLAKKGGKTTATGDPTYDYHGTLFVPVDRQVYNYYDTYSTSTTVNNTAPVNPTITIGGTPTPTMPVPVTGGNSPVPVPATNPAPAPISGSTGAPTTVPNPVQTIQQINQTVAANPTTPNIDTLHQQKVDAAAKLGYTVTQDGYVYDVSGHNIPSLNPTHPVASNPLPQTAPPPSDAALETYLANAGSQWNRAGTQADKDKIHTAVYNQLKNSGASYDDTTGEWTRNGLILNGALAGQHV